MGAGTFVTQNRPARSVDVPLALATLGLLVFGLIMLFSASWDFSLSLGNSPMHMFNRQLMWLGIGLVGVLILANFDYHYYRKLIVPAMALTILLLIGVLLVQEIRLGAKRAFFDGSVQPSELAKIVSII